MLIFFICTILTFITNFSNNYYTIYYSSYKILGVKNRLCSCDQCPNFLLLLLPVLHKEIGEAFKKKLENIVFFVTFFLDLDFSIQIILLCVYFILTTTFLE